MVLLGSPNDWDVVKAAGVELDRLAVAWEAHVASAHRSLDRTLDLVRRADAEGVRVFICAAGMAAHLAGVVAASTTRPVIGIPLAGGVADGLDALLATVQMPPGVPVATVAVGRAGARNAAILAAQILSVYDDALRARLGDAKAALAEAVATADAELDSGKGEP